ncbi:MAG: alanine--tRNA ligase [Planctomycetota bacterium]|nr:alanine--tRNA ligase [Planctomycetota bacterium]
MNSSQVRQTFLEFFQEKEHKIVPSSPVVPHGDKTLLFANAGMVQFKEIFTGKEKARTPRATTAQKCIRAGGKHNDLDNVGYTTRHLTFFEMLGNFSFGDYFKKEAIAYAWELVTRGFGVDPGSLWVTVYREDDEARQLWREVSGLADERIAGLGEKGNFWSMGDVGPCGPCSEILIDRGDRYGECDVENGERFFEIWNLVFMQYEQEASGRRSPLPRPSIDTGMGLERMAMVLQGVDTVFETDILRSLIRRIEEISGVGYDPGEAGVPHRVLADHVRSLVFALADGAEISNEGRGYVMRRILRRASRYGRKIHEGGPILCQLVPTLVDAVGAAYPEIADKQEFVTLEIRREEENFGKTLDRGLELFEDVAAKLRKKGETMIPGVEVFHLYSTYGFPVDLVERMADEAGLRVDLDGYHAEMEEERARSRKFSTFQAVASDGRAEHDVEAFPETRFVGYDACRAEAELQAAFDQGGVWQVILSDTPFYGESGGQVGDTGVIEGDNFRLRVDDTQKRQGRFIHVCQLEEGAAGDLRPGCVVRSVVDHARRAAIARNHSATHLLHAALRQVIGRHVHQKGSLVAPGRLRFDVSHFEAIGPDELDEVSELVRRKILENVAVEIREMGHDEAIEAGALAFFGEQYGERVRVVRMGEFSAELCGGIHVERTGDVGSFVVVHEGSVSSGVRRLEALTAHGADEYHQGNSRLIDELASTLRVKPDGLVDRVTHLLGESRDLRSKLRRQGSTAREGTLRRRQVGDILLVSGLYDGISGKELREVYDGFKQESPRLISSLVARTGGKVQVLVTVSPPLVEEGWRADAIFQAGAEMLKARGGGRPEMVQAGGNAPEGAEKALQAFEARLEQGP